MSKRALLLFSLIASLFAGGCAGPAPYKYRYVSGKTAVLHGPYAVAPEKAPPDVHATIAAANRIAGLPYGYGRGHGPGFDSAYDCSGAASCALMATGKLRSPTTSHGFRKFGKKGPGKWISIYARKGHVFLVVAGLRFDTGWSGEHGPQWSTKSRPTRGCVIRHPAGL